MVIANSKDLRILNLISETSPPSSYGICSVRMKSSQKKDFFIFFHSLYILDPSTGINIFLAPYCFLQTVSYPFISESQGFWWPHFSTFSSSVPPVHCLHCWPFHNYNWHSQQLHHWHGWSFQNLGVSVLSLLHVTSVTPTSLLIVWNLLLSSLLSVS